MGLDIIAYSSLSNPIDVNYDELSEDEQDDIHDNYISLYFNPDFPDHAKDITSEFFKDGIKEVSFQAGSYSGYNIWRNWLATIGGFKSDEDVWENFEQGPFVEMINFSDCEGVIGPAYCAKLYKDFVDYQHVVDALPEDQDYNKQLYHKWKEAFRVSCTGAVEFC